MEREIRKIALLCSGGDAPGMNAAIRAVVRSGIYNGLEVLAVKNGFEGIIKGDFIEMESSSVSNIIQRGGTILKTARSERFKTPEGRNLAYEQLRSNGVDGVVVIGGNGSLTGASEFSSSYDIPWIGIPKTIDNDLYGTDFAIGYDTAINTAMQAIDKIRDTADSHNRLFFVEVMGRDAGFIAIRTGIATGAEAILVPETHTDINYLIEMLEKDWKRKKTSMIVVVAEGDDAGGAFEIAKKVKEKFNHYDTRVSILGHMQRGGSPSCMDRVLASRLGVAAVDALLQGKKNVMVGLIHDTIAYTPFEKAVKQPLDVNKNLLKILEILAS